MSTNVRITPTPNFQTSWPDPSGVIFIRSDSSLGELALDAMIDSCKLTEQL